MLYYVGIVGFFHIRSLICNGQPTTAVSAMALSFQSGKGTHPARTWSHAVRMNDGRTICSFSRDCGVLLLRFRISR